MIANKLWPRIPTSINYGTALGWVSLDMRGYSTNRINRLEEFSQLLWHMNIRDSIWFALSCTRKKRLIRRYDEDAYGTGSSLDCHISRNWGNDARRCTLPSLFWCDRWEFGAGLVNKTLVTEQRCRRLLSLTCGWLCLQYNVLHRCICDHVVNRFVAREWFACSYMQEIAIQIINNCHMKPLMQAPLNSPMNLVVAFKAKAI